MKLYIDWERRAIYSDKQVLIEDLIEHEHLNSFRSYLELHYYIDDIFNLNNQEKENIKKDYKAYLEREVETFMKTNPFYFAVLEVDSIEETYKELN